MTLTMIVYCPPRRAGYTEGDVIPRLIAAIFGSSFAPVASSRSRLLSFDNGLGWKELIVGWLSAYNTLLVLNRPG